VTRFGNNAYSLEFDIKNISDSEIWFPADMNVNIEAWNPRTLQWVKLKNLTSYAPSNGSIVLASSKDSLMSELVFGIDPEFPKEFLEQSSVRMKISIAGLKIISGQVTDRDIQSEYIFILEKDKP
jgi:hypothetical protein